MRIEAARQALSDLPITPKFLAHLRETARLFSTHYSTMIEGNRLTKEQVQQAVHQNEHFPGKERDELEVKGYYAALDLVESLARKKAPLQELSETKDQSKTLRMLDAKQRKTLTLFSKNSVITALDIALLFNYSTAR
jgi:Fic family protein